MRSCSKPFPYPSPDRLVFLNESLPKAGYLNVAWPDFLDWRAQNQVFDHIERRSTVAASSPSRACRRVRVKYAAHEVLEVVEGSRISSRPAWKLPTRPSCTSPRRRCRWAS